MEKQQTLQMVQALAVVVHMIIIIPGRVFASFILLYYLIYGSFITKTIAIAYVIHRILDRNTPQEGGRRVNWMIHLAQCYLNAILSYFPITAVKLAEVPTDKNYILGIHPHGALFFSTLLGIGSGLIQRTLSQKLNCVMATINSNFTLPLAREYFLSMGVISVSEKSIKHFLNDPAKGNVVGILPGGSKEAEYTKPNEYHLYLNRRKGFCRVALETGSSIIPTFAFGEVDVYTVDRPPEDSFIAKIQNFILKHMEFNPIFYRHPDSNIWFFSMPKRTPISIVMGEPIHTTKTENPTAEEIAKLHGQFRESIKYIFETQKHKYLANADTAVLKFI